MSHFCVGCHKYVSVDNVTTDQIQSKGGKSTRYVMRGTCSENKNHKICKMVKGQDTTQAPQRIQVPPIVKPTPRHQIKVPHVQGGGTSVQTVQSGGRYAKP